MPLFLPQKTIVLAASGVAVSHTGTITKTALVTIVVPGGLMGPQGRLRVTALWTNNNNANNKTVFIEFGATGFLGSTNTTTIAQNQQITIANRNSLSSQVGFGGLFGGFGASGAAVTTSAINTAIDQNLVFSVQLANAADTAALEHYLVELIRP